jgi:hypothetical protein
MLSLLLPRSVGLLTPIIFPDDVKGMFVVHPRWITATNRFASSLRTIVTHSKSTIELAHQLHLIAFLSSLSGNIGVLLLCEVAVKPWLELTDAHYDADKAAKNANKL